MRLLDQLENDFTQLGVIDLRQDTYSKFGGLKDIAIKNNLEQSKLVDSIKQKIVPDAAKPETVPATSNEAQQPETTVKVPEVQDVARVTQVPDINQVINRPISAERAEVLFPQDELLQASLKRRA